MAFYKYGWGNYSSIDEGYRQGHTMLRPSNKTHPITGHCECIYRPDSNKHQSGITPKTIIRGSKTRMMIEEYLGE